MDLTFIFDREGIRMKKESTKCDSHVMDLWRKCESVGVVADINKRWEEGIDHHPRAIEMFDIIKEADWAFCDDHFCWKSGGDGDNGEALMYSLSVMFELYDKLEKKE